jgi:hypothetical protein
MRDQGLMHGIADHDGGDLVEAKLVDQNKKKKGRIRLVPIILLTIYPFGVCSNRMSER